MWVRARAARDARRRTGEHERPDKSDEPHRDDRTADVVARIHEIDSARLRMPRTWEADVDARVEEKIARLRHTLASLEVRVTDLAQEQDAMAKSWEPVLALVQTLAKSIEERLVVCPMHTDEAPRRADRHRER